MQTVLERLFGSRLGNLLLLIAVAGLVLSGLGYHSDVAYVTARIATLGYIGNGIREFHRRRREALRRKQ
jgi:hypothetical protein